MVAAGGGGGGHEDSVEDVTFLDLEVVEDRCLWWNKKNLLYRKLCPMGFDLGEPRHICMDEYFLRCPSKDNPKNNDINSVSIPTYARPWFST